MEKRFFLYGVPINDTRIPIHQTVELPLPIFTYSTKTSSPFRDTAPPGAQLTLDLSSIQGSKIGGQLCLNQTFLGHLCLHGLRKTEKRSETKRTKSSSAKLQEVPLRQAKSRNAHRHGLRLLLCQIRRICEAFIHSITVKAGLGIHGRKRVVIGKTKPMFLYFPGLSC